MAGRAIFIVGEVTTDTVVGVYNAIGQAKQNDPPADEIRLLIDSHGGSLSHGIAIYNLLRASGMNVVAHNISQVASVANIVFLAGDERYASKHSYFHHHGSFNSMSGNVHRVMFEDALATMKAAERIMTDIFVERTKLRSERVAALFHSPIAMDPDEALQVGLIHAIKELS